MGAGRFRACKEAQKQAVVKLETACLAGGTDSPRSTTQLLRFYTHCVGSNSPAAPDKLAACGGAVRAFLECAKKGKAVTLITLRTGLP